MYCLNVFTQNIMALCKKSWYYLIIIKFDLEDQGWEMPCVPRALGNWVYLTHETHLKEIYYFDEVHSINQM